MFIRSGFPTRISTTRSKENGVIKTTLTLETVYSYQLQQLHEKFYINGKRIIPDDLEITPIILLHLYIGDGGCSKKDIYINTQNFTEKDVLKLIEKINRKLEIQARIQEVKNTNSPKRQYFDIIIGRNRDQERFFNYISEAPSESVNHAKQIFPWKFDPNLREKDFKNKF